MPIYCQEFLDLIQSISFDNKYLKWYITLCAQASLRGSDRSVINHNIGYVEQHHIIPKSLKIVNEKVDKNLVYLTPREHFLCHRFLAKMFSNSLWKKKMNAAVFMMCNTTYMISSRQYEFLRFQHFKTNIPSIHTRKKMAASLKNLIWIKREQTNEFLRVSSEKAQEFYKLGFIKGRKPRINAPVHSIANRRKISMSHILRVKITCEYCGLVCSKHMHTRWHGNKCKAK